MLLDPKWLDAVKLPLRVIAGLFLGSVALLIIDNHGWVLLKELGGPARTIVAITAVLTGALTFTGLSAILLETWGQKRKRDAIADRRRDRDDQRRRQRQEAEASVIARIEFLSEGELRHIAGALRDNSQSFYTWVHSPTVTTLMEKGLVRTLGGTHHEDHYPFTIVDFAWKYLIENRDEIIAKDNAIQRAKEAAKRRGR